MIIFVSNDRGLSMRGFIGAALIGAVTAAVLLPSASFAQKGKQQDLSPMQELDLEKKRDHEAVDREYQRTMKSTTGNASTAKVDPWANMRGPADTSNKK
ncbi:MAG TPA: hypothetical protein VHD34_07470 [Xanthobacteraceae bacterium]|nr:hypothetical protein [Xanthobacteraceae bacterium]